MKDAIASLASNLRYITLIFAIESAQSEGAGLLLGQRDGNSQRKEAIMNRSVPFLLVTAATVFCAGLGLLRAGWISRTPSAAIRSPELPPDYYYRHTGATHWRDTVLTR